MAPVTRSGPQWCDEHGAWEWNTDHGHVRYVAEEWFDPILVDADQDVAVAIVTLVTVGIVVAGVIFLLVVIFG